MNMISINIFWGNLLELVKNYEPKFIIRVFLIFDKLSYIIV